MHDMPFHSGEIRAQALAGGGAAGVGIRPFMSDQHRLFLASLPIVFLGLADEAGWPVATLLTGEPGFVSSPDPRRLHIRARLAEADPACPGPWAGRKLGVLGLEFGTRRRNRANGVIVSADAHGLTLAIEQSFGNCAKFIQAREVRAARAHPAPPEHLGALDDDATALIRSADTFFVASGSSDHVHGGLDVSHRRGRPGFVRVSDNALSVPDFPGNRFYNTLGNLLDDSRAGLLFIDFQRGDLLQLRGTVSVDWHPVDAPAGAERLWRFEIEAATRRRSALPLRFSPPTYSPASFATGTW